jgi:hypothetical protein
MKVKKPALPEKCSTKLISMWNYLKPHSEFCKIIHAVQRKVCFLTIKGNLRLGFLGEKS